MWSLPSSIGNLRNSLGIVRDIMATLVNLGKIKEREVMLEMPERGL